MAGQKSSGRQDLNRITKTDCGVVCEGTSLYVSKPSSQPTDPGRLANLLASEYSFAIRYRDILTIARSSRQGIFRVSEQVKPPKGVPFDVVIAKDGSSAMMVPRSGQVPKGNLRFLDLLHAVLKANVSCGILYEKLDWVVDNWHEMDENGMEIAIQIEPIPGRNAQFQFHFDPEKNFAPLVREDGSVDFHRIDVVKAVEEGQVLVTKKPPSPGKDGRKVTGQPIPAVSGQDLPLPKGNMTRVSPDGMTLVSLCKGHAFIQNEVVNVEEVLIVSENVDYSTGDVTYGGDVVIRGNVLSDFKVRGTGNVNILQHVERAVVESVKESIIVTRGVHGGGKALLQAPLDIRSGFAERAQLIAGRDIIVGDYLIHCDVKAGNDVKVLGGKGIVLGGTIRVGRSLHCKLLGSEAGGQTRVEVGGSAGEDKSKEIEKMRAHQKPIEEEIQKIQKTLDLMREIAADTREVEDLLDEHRESWQKIENEIISAYGLSEDSVVLAERKLLPGVTIVLGQKVFKVPMEYGPSCVRLVDGEVSVGPLDVFLKTKRKNTK